MMHSCPLGFDADRAVELLGADDPHVRACEVCELRARALEATKAIWRHERERNERLPRRASERRMRATFARALPRRSPAPGALVMATAVLGAALVFGHFERRAPSTDDQSPVAPLHVGPVANRVEPPRTLAPSSAPERRSPPRRRLVVVQDCAACALVNSAAKAGVILDGGPLIVPKGASLILSWSVDGYSEKDALFGAVVQVDGPSAVNVIDDGAESRSVLLADGTATLGAASEGELCTKLARTSVDGSQPARWRVTASADRTRVAAISGAVSVESRTTRTAGLSASVVLHAGETADVWADGRVVRANERAANSAARRMPQPDAGAAPILEPRAIFAKAELELAAGDMVSARARLSALVTGPDSTLAEDAATLLASSYPAAVGRADAWAYVLATAGAAPLRARARVERAIALERAGDLDQARSLAAEAKREKELLPEPTVQRLYALAARLDVR
jgi:hypothetical protein